MIYYSVKLDDCNKPYLSETQTPEFTPGYMILNTDTQETYMSEFIEFQKYEDEDEHIFVKITYNNKLIPIDRVEIITLEDFSNMYNYSTSKKYDISKETKSKIIVNGKYRTFTKIIVNAIVKYGRDIKLSQKDHSRKMSLISTINKIAETGDKDISISKAEELMKLYALDFKEIFREDLR